MWLEILFAFGCANFIYSTTIDLGGVISGNRMAAVPLGRTISNGILDVEGVCSKAGMACQDCNHAVTCVMLPGGWLKVPLQECTDDKTCNAHLGSCSNHHVPECDAAKQNHQHSCEQVGIFPDAVDCRKFHLCSPGEGLPDGRPADHRVALCPRHYGYDPLTAQCSVQLNNGQCNKSPTPPCTEVGQTGVLADSANHYYVCLSKGDKLYPQIFICPNGWYFYDGYCHSEPTNKTITTESTKEIIEERTTTRIESFFSTEKVTTNPPDTFLADKFYLSNYESTDDAQPTNDFPNSFESSEFF